jgi:hypothetical protein
MEDCRIPAVYCGSKRMPLHRNNKRYTRQGTPTECLRSGVGAGIYMEKRRRLPENHIENIPYIGELYSKRFRNRKINNLSSLKKKMKSMTSSEKEIFLKKVLLNKNKKLDKRAYNSVIYYLYNQGVRRLPKCSKISS